MTEEIEAHVLKKYEILQKLGKFKISLSWGTYSKISYLLYIGKGAYGIVWKAIDKRTKEICAVKKNFDAF
jgi:mitogen-activated protein kinase 15